MRGHQCLEKWDLIPDDTDVLITHGPPVGHGDLCFDQQRAGCVELLNTIQHRVHPKVHLFGHIHEGYGLTADGHTTYINACTCTLRYRPTNPAIVFDLPIPIGHGVGDASDDHFNWAFTHPLLMSLSLIVFYKGHVLSRIDGYVHLYTSYTGLRIIGFFFHMSQPLTTVDLCFVYP